MKNAMDHKSKTAYVALLRGINVGGNSLVPMAKLKKVFESMGFKNVKTVLASGNVIFEGEGAGRDALREKIEGAIEKDFKRHFDVIVYKIRDLEKIAEKYLFKGIAVTPETRLYATFLSEKPRGAKMPPPSEGLQILSVKDGVILSVLRLVPGRGTVDLMSFIEKEYGKKITTRSWGTVLKIIKAGGENIG